MRLCFISLLSYLLCLPALSDSIPGEWVVTRAERSGWPASLGTGARLVRIFGDGRRALVRSRVRPKKSNGLIRVQPNYLYQAGAVEYTDPDMPSAWGLKNAGDPIAGVPCAAGKDIGAFDAWKVHQGNHETIVAVIDSGIDLAHEDLKTNHWINPREIAGNGIDDDGNGFIDDVNGWNFVSHRPDVSDDLDHGTFVAGLIAADADNGKGSRGLLREVSVMSLKVLDANGVGSTVSTVAAVDYAVRAGAHVLNLSWGGTERDPALADALERAGRAGVLVVASAGNDRKDNDVDPKPYFPASFSLPNLIAVSAYDCRDELASFSSFGKRSVHLGAPGVALPGPIRGGYRLGSGTSFAAPYVAGVAALLRSHLPSLTLAELRERLLQTSEVIHYYEKERLVSAGRVHAALALEDVRPPRPSAPASWHEDVENVGTPHPYPHKHAQSWTIRRPGATRLRVHFRGFATERAFDVVSLSDAKGRAIASYSGSRGDFWSADAIGDTIELKFHSDYLIDGFGFDIDSVGASFDPFDWQSGALLE